MNIKIGDELILGTKREKGTVIEIYLIDNKKYIKVRTYLFQFFKKLFYYDYDYADWFLLIQIKEAKDMLVRKQLNEIEI